MAIPIVVEALGIVAVSSIALIHFAILGYAHRLVDSLRGLELFACWANREDIILRSIYDKELARSNQTCEIAHIAQLHNTGHIVAVAVVDSTDATLVRAEA